MVAQRLASSPCSEHLHLIIDVEVDESGRAVAEHRADDVQGVNLQGVAAVEAPTHPQRLSLQAIDGGVAWSGDGLQGGEHRLANVLTGLPLSEVAVDDGNDLIGIEVAGHADGYVVRAIPLIEVVLDVHNRRILQVFLRADGGLCAIGVGGEEHLAHRLPELARVLCDADVIFFVDGLQLRVETTDDHVLETVALNACPVLHFVRGDVLGVARHIVRRVGIRALGTDGSHEFVVLVRNEIAGSQL